MKLTLWMFLVFFGLIYLSPVLLIMMALVLTDIPLYNAFLYWTPIAVFGSLAISFWYHRQGLRQQQQ